MEKIILINNALALLGEYSIESIENDGRVEDLVNYHYDSVWKEVLNSYNWSDAIRYVQLSQLSTSPLTEYDYQYQLPSNCLRVISLNETSDRLQSEHYILQGDKLLTNEDTALIKYIEEIDSTTVDPQLSKVFYTELAIRLAIPLVKSSDLRNRLQQDQQGSNIPKARYLNSIEQNPKKKLIKSKWLTARHRGATTRGYTYEVGY